MKKFPILYSRTSLGQVQQWQIKVENNTFYTEEGIVDGKITRSSPTSCESKNVGKSNQTTPEEQALKEAKARHKKQIETGYFESIKDIDKVTFFSPMTAKKWKDRWKKVKFPVYCQPKLDGMRCIIKKDGMWSRYGKRILSAPHILEQLNGWFDIHSEAIFDGELYAHKFKKDFEQIISLAKQGKPTEEDLAKSAEHLEYWVYDYFNPNQPLETFEERISRLIEIFKHLKNHIKNLKIVLVETKLCKNIEELDVTYQEYLDNGMEGQMVRIPGSIYENKRSNNLLKRKEFIDEEFPIDDIVAGKGGHAHMAAKAILRAKNGKPFEAGLIGSHEYCEQLLRDKDKIIGKKKGTVVYQNLTNEGVPRFGKMKIVRDYE